MKRRLVLAGAALVAVSVTAGVAAPADVVTLKVERLPENRVVFSGTIPSAAPDEYVAIMWQTARIWVGHYRGGRHRVTLSADSNLLGRFVELQRLSAGRWTRIRRARLEGGSAFVFYTTFTVRKRGLRLRVLVPHRTAAPCHPPIASMTFVS